MLEFDVKVTADDMFKFNLRHIYSTFQGWVSVLLGLFLLFVGFYSWNSLSAMNRAIYVGAGLLMIVYVPINMKLKSAHVVQSNEELFSSLHFIFDDEKGVLASSKVTAEEEAALPWDYVYKVKCAKDALYIYSNKINAYIIPRECVKSKETQITECLKKNVEDYKLSLKGWK